MHTPLPLLAPNASTDITLDVVTIDSLNLPAYHAFEHALYTSDVELSTFAKWINEPCDTPDPHGYMQNTIAPRYERFRDEFRDESGIGIMLKLTNQHDNDALDLPVFALDLDDIQLNTKSFMSLIGE